MVGQIETWGRTMASSKLLDKTLDLVRNRPRDMSYDDLAAASKVNPHWLKKLASGKIEHPSVCHVEAVYVALTGKPLEL